MEVTLPFTADAGLKSLLVCVEGSLRCRCLCDVSEMQNQLSVAIGEQETKRVTCCRYIRRCFKEVFVSDVELCW